MHSFVSATFFITFVSLTSAIPAYTNIYTLAGTNFIYQQNYILGKKAILYQYYNIGI